MKSNPLVLALVVLALLGGAVYYTQENPPAPDSDKVPIVEAAEADIQQITVHKPTGDAITVVRGEDDKWTFGGGLTIPADDSAIGLMATNLGGMSADRLVEEQVTDWSPFGLDGDGALSVELKTKQDSTQKIVFGSETPTGSGVFARIDGDPRLFTVYSYVKTSFEKDVFDWRDKKLLQVESDKIVRLKLKVGAKAFEFGKPDEGTWQILEPAPLRGDNFTIGDLARSIYNAEMTAVLEEGAAEPSAAYDFARPFAVAEIIDPKGVHTLTLAQGRDDSYYAKSSDLEGGVYEIASSVAEGLDKELQEFRNKKLFDFGFQTPSKIDIRSGDTHAVIEKSGEDWKLSGGDELDSEKVQTMIDSLRNLAAIAFPSDSAADQIRFGLSSPAIEATVTNGPDQVETVLVTDPAADRIYAARKGEASTYEIEKAPADEILRSLEELLKPAEADPPPASGSAADQTGSE